MLGVEKGRPRTRGGHRERKKCLSAVNLCSSLGLLGSGGIGCGLTRSDRLSVAFLRTRRLSLDGSFIVTGLGSRPLGRSGPFRLLPGAHVAESASARALAGTAELDGKVLGRDLSQELLLVVAAQNVDLLHSDGVQEALDDTEDAAESPGGIDQVQLAQPLRVVVLRDSGRLADIAVDGRHVGDADSLQVHDRAAGLQQLASLARASGQTGVSQLLVFADEVLQHALAGGDLVHRIEVNLAQLLDIDGSSILRTRHVSTHLRL